MIAAVLAVLASTQLAAATETVRQTGSAGSPARGRRMCWITSPPQRQRRARVLAVARPPPRILTTAAGPAAGAFGRPLASWTRIRRPSGGGSPATAMSPPRLTRTPQDRRGGSRGGARAGGPPPPGGPPGRWGPGGRAQPPRRRIEPYLPPARHLPYREPQRRAGLADDLEVTVVANRGQCRADRRIHVPARLPTGDE